MLQWIKILEPKLEIPGHELHQSLIEKTPCKERIPSSRYWCPRKLFALLFPYLE
jgi:hypothetical protein